MFYYHKFIILNVDVESFVKSFVSASVFVYGGGGLGGETGAYQLKYLIEKRFSKITIYHCIKCLFISIHWAL